MGMVCLLVECGLIVRSSGALECRYGTVNFKYGDSNLYVREIFTNDYPNLSLTTNNREGTIVFSDV